MVLVVPQKYFQNGGGSRRLAKRRGRNARNEEKVRNGGKLIVVMTEGD